jgi:protein transport protein SEC31
VLLTVAGSDGLLTRSLLTANFEAAVDVCLSHGRMAEALVLAIAGGPELLGRTQKAFFDANKSSVDQVNAIK